MIGQLDYRLTFRTQGCSINLFIYVLTQYLKWEVQFLRYCRFLANRYKSRKVALKVPFFDDDEKEDNEKVNELKRALDF